MSAPIDCRPTSKMAVEIAVKAPCAKIRKAVARVNMMEVLVFLR